MFQKTVFTIKMIKTMKKQPMMMCSTQSYTTESFHTEKLLNRLFNTIDCTSVLDPHPTLIMASHKYSEPPPEINDVYLHTLSIMDLLNQFAYPSISGYGKFSILLTILRSYGEEITFSIGKAIPLTDYVGNLLPKNFVYSQIFQSIMKYSEIYEGTIIVKVTIKVYLINDKLTRCDPSLSEEERYTSLYSIIQEGFPKGKCESLPTRVIRHSKRRYSSYITSLKECKTKRNPFIVSDLETLLVNNIHTPYAAGLLIVRPDKDISEDMIETYYSEDYSIIFDSIEE